MFYLKKKKEKISLNYPQYSLLSGALKKQIWTTGPGCSKHLSLTSSLRGQLLSVLQPHNQKH